MSDTADVIVVGGGPAGLAVALGAARHGLRAVVFDKRDGVVDKACGEGLMPPALAALHRLGLDPPGHPITGIVYRQDATEARASFPGPAGRGVRRTVLHETLRGAASAAGVELRTRAVSEIVRADDHVVAGGVRGRYLVVADGLHSPLRRSLGLDRQGATVRRWGLRRHFAAAPWSDSVEVTWGRDAEAYVTPLGPDLVGVAVLSRRQDTFDDHLAAFPQLAARLADARPASSVRGAGPLRQPVVRRVAGRVLLAGDAAGYVDALTGEGLALAFTTAEALVRCLERDRPEEYEHEWLRLSRRSRWITSGLLWARHRPRVSRAVVPLAAAAPPLFSFAVGQLAR